ncbi:NAC domain-containing protein [Jimgerdemannia flammicorona]|uniref:Nascent polypeptide-associated complex subunit beta n=1 Tax=Jimgerdemannia flammicorona TaxID=994334 RepID=A0A433D9D6_9FUNG|nr:NAC domain-containing protein [Jimgerdemannia flammicorona]
MALHGFCSFRFYRGGSRHKAYRSIGFANRYICQSPQGVTREKAFTSSTQPLHFRTIMNPEKLAKLKSQVRIGGKGTPRRKHKTVHKSSSTDDKKLQATLKKLNVQSVIGVEEVNMFKEDGNVIHFAAPKVHTAVGANTFAIYGQGEEKELTELGAYSNDVTCFWAGIYCNAY